jgi:glycosyltransferase involved in cell wall biosynthesis
MNIYNGAPYLREAIDSVIAQTHSDWELIAWDDCSTDNSANIVKSYQDARIRYFLAHQQVTIGLARHLALGEVKGEWVAFLDQDDIWTPAKIEKQLALGTTSPEVGIVYGRTISFYPSGYRQDFDHRHEFEPLPEGALLERLFLDASFISMSSAMFRRSALEELGGIAPEINIIPDYYMYLGISKHYTTRAVQEVVCHYRLHGNNMSPRNFKQLHLECLWVIDRWGRGIKPGLLAHRRAVHQTLVALEEVKKASKREGLMRLLTKGSLTYLFSRPFARSFRALRRRIQTPYWQRRSN